MNPKFHREVLKNGMTILFEKRETPAVSVAFAVRNGGINEAENEKGISHFIEHMLYKGTITRNSKKICEEIEKKGGDLDGFTDETITAYWCKMPSKHLDIALDVFGDMINNPLFNKNELEKERKVIFEEIKMGEDDPSNYVIDKISSCLYEKPFGMGVLGTIDTLNSINQEKIIEKFKKVYKPNNLICCVVGDAKLNKIIKFAEKNFGNEKGLVDKFEIKKKNELKIEEREGISQANLILAYHAPLADDNKSYASKVLHSLMTEGMSSRLFYEIREKRNLAYSILGFYQTEKDFACGGVYVGTAKENVSLVEKIILEEFKKVADNLTETELNHVKEGIIGNHQISMEGSASQMINLLEQEVKDNAKKFYDFEKNISNVKLDDVKTLANLKEYSFFALIPK